MPREKIHLVLHNHYNRKSIIYLSYDKIGAEEPFPIYKNLERTLSQLGVNYQYSFRTWIKENYTVIHVMYDDECRVWRKSSGSIRIT